MINRLRRTFLQGSAALAALAAGLLVAGRAWAAWPKAAFEAKEVPETLTALFPGGAPSASNAIAITLPEIAENGSQVPVVVRTELPNVDSITVIAEANPRPLVATATCGPRTVPMLSTRMKLAKTMKITAVVRSDGKLYASSREVKVSIGGCGG